MNYFRAAVVLSFLSAWPASGGILDPAPPSNVFVLGDLNLAAANVQGGLTIGGAGTLRAANVGSIYDQGNLSLVAVNVAGSVLYGGRFTVTGGNIGAAAPLSPPLINFPAVGLSLAATSAFYGSLPSTGNLSGPTLGMLILAGTDPLLNTFTIAPPGFNTNVVIDAPPGSTVVINVPGSSPAMTLVNLNGVPGSGAGFDPTHVLFNFPEATSLQFSSDSIWGTVLAPLANVTVVGGGEWGTMIAGSLTALTTNFYDAPFVPPPAVPEPRSFLLLAGSLVGLFALRMTRRSVRDADETGSGTLADETGSGTLNSRVPDPVSSAS